MSGCLYLTQGELNDHVFEHAASRGGMSTRFHRQCEGRTYAKRLVHMRLGSTYSERVVYHMPTVRARSQAHTRTHVYIRSRVRAHVAVNM